MSKQEDQVGEAGVNGLNGHTDGPEISFDALIIGAGFAGLRMLYELRKQGLSGRVFDTASGVGGTWFWNRYPGARTDSESWVFIFTFLEELGMEWEWKERFPQQPEVERYLNKLTDYLCLRQDIQLNTNIVDAHRDEEKNIWKVTTDKGETFTCKYLITAVGVLATPLKPTFPGLDSFQGEWYQTGTWPNRHIDFEGKRVGIVGTGATAVQVAPIVAHSAKSLTLFQRTPNYVVPGRNHPIDKPQMDAIKRDYEGICKRARSQSMGFDMIDSPVHYDDLEDEAAIQRVLDSGWEKGGFHYFFETFGDMLTNPKTNKAASDFVRNKIRAIVKDQKTAELLCPEYPVFSKRPPAGHNFYQIFNRPNVELVNIKNDPIQEITPNGLKLGSREFEFDIIIFAIGFDAVTGTLSKIGIHGDEDQKLADVLGDDLSTNFGITIPGFSNMFMIFGPQGPFANGPLIIDNAADWIGRTLSYMKTNHIDRIGAKRDSAEQWCNHCEDIFNTTVVAQSSKQVAAWYVGANVKAKQQKTLFYFGGMPAYIAASDKEIKDGYPGHILTTASKISAGA